ncbi:MAG TPA: hypothetical protein VNC84_05490 [Gammaproteobacteria bacterium]|jgi:hypothetical protein|nr:hypothetical protein [Gammaproteobacteria bacterium]
MSNALSRICSICGQTKSLRAFLQSTDSERLVYGTICDDCRSKKAESHEDASMDADSSTGSTRLEKKIDSKAFKEMRAHEERMHQAKQEKDAEQRKQKEEREAVVQENKEETATKKYRSFLDKTPLDKATLQATTQHKTVFSATQKAEPRQGTSVQQKEPATLQKTMAEATKQATTAEKAASSSSSTESKEKQANKNDSASLSNTAAPNVIRETGEAWKAFVKTGSLYGEMVKRINPTAADPQAAEKQVKDFINKKWPGSK